MSEALKTYFRGEAQVGMMLAAVGLLWLGGAYWAWRTNSGSFATGLCAPLALIGSLMVLGGPAFVWKTHAQVARLEAELQSDAHGMVARESARMERVNANWPRLKTAWGVLTIVALALILLVRREWAPGVGLALLATCATLFFIDVFAERRAVVYTAALTSSR
jgi:hypothetical protein